LGVLSVRARRVTDKMFMASAKCIAELSPAARSNSGRLLPSVSELRSVSFAVARAVALQAIEDGVADPLATQTIDSRICANVWQPVYLPYRFCPSE
jgi:malate dehydrogenase (oxaloacetate-decarboxylating)